MTSSPRDPGPQDRIRGERPPGAHAQMPVIGPDGLGPESVTGEVVPARGASAPVPASGSAPVARSQAGASDDSSSLYPVFGDVRKSGPWRVPRELGVYQVFGDAVLDLREAVFTSDEVVITTAGVFGDVKVIVPPGVYVELSGMTIFGDHKQDHRPGTPPPGFPRVRVDGYSAFGDVKVRCLEVGEQEKRWWKRSSPDTPAS